MEYFLDSAVQNLPWMLWWWIYYLSNYWADVTILCVCNIFNKSYCCSYTGNKEWTVFKNWSLHYIYGLLFGNQWFFLLGIWHCIPLLTSVIRWPLFSDCWPSSLTAILWLLFAKRVSPPKHIHKIPFLFCFRGFIYSEEILHPLHFVCSRFGTLLILLQLWNIICLLKGIIYINHQNLKVDM